MKLALPLPKASEWDPLVEGEGRLDPLGLSAIAGRLADTYASPVRARMRRVRFLTASCLGAIVVAPLEGFLVADGGDTPELAFERLLVEAFARSGADVGTGVPGITKAAAAVRSRRRLDSRGYLKSPRVFGFNGVYRPLALGLRLVDRAGGPLDRADELVAMWLTESAFPGLTEGSGEVQGQRLVDWLTAKTAAALETGHNTFGVTSDYARLIALALLPEKAGSGERMLMRKWLTDPAVDPVMPEVIRRLHDMGKAAGEPEATLVARLAEEGSRDLRVRMLAVVAFEEFAQDLEWAFDSYRFASSAAVGGSIETI